MLRMIQVGTEFVRGVSGGERKRTTIAMELITSPRVLFLDEPTTGLDANTAHSVMHLLQRLAAALLVPSRADEYSSVMNIHQ